MSLGTCLVLQPHASYIVSLQHVPMYHSTSCEHLNMLVVHGHGRGTHLSTCLVYAAFVVAFAACVNGCEFFGFVFGFVTLVVDGHGRCKRLNTCLVFELCALCVISLQDVSMFDDASGARAWTRQAPWYLPCGEAVCIVCC